MIKITHVNKLDEDKVADMVATYLFKNYRYYFEVKNYGNGDMHPPTRKQTSRTMEVKK